MSALSESVVEDAALEWLAGLGYAVAHGPDIGPEGSAPERGSYAEVLLADRLRKALARLNPHLPAETLEDVLRKVRQAETPSLTEENRRLHRYLVEGVWRDNQGETSATIKMRGVATVDDALLGVDEARGARNAADGL